MKQFVNISLMAGFLMIFSLSVFGQSGTISLHQYCSAGYEYTWNININDYKAVKLTYSSDIPYNSANFYIQENIGNYPIFLSSGGYESGIVCTTNTSGLAYVSISVSTDCYVNFEVEYCAYTPGITEDQIHVGANGYVGVGQLDPQEKLHINGAIRGNSTGGALKVKTQYGFIDVGAMNGSFANIYTDMPEFAFDKPIDLISGKLTSYTNTNLYLQTGRGIDRLTILNSNGNVGIGTTNPNAKLDVKGNSLTSYINFAGTGSGNVKMGTTGGGGQYGALWMNQSAPSTLNYALLAGSGMTIFNAQAGEYLYFAEANVPKMTIKNGYVGIGTTTPSEKLTVAGDHGDTKIRLYSTGNGSDIPSNLSLWASEPGWTYYGTGIGYNVNGSPRDGRIDNTRGSSYVRFLPGETKFQFQNTSGINVDAMTILESGKVGIGISNITTDALLTVNGIIHAREIKVSLEGLADYVFNSDYSLMPLPEVEKFVKENKHLPEIPSANEVQKNGLSVGEMQNKLLQKIEELTLYVIEQQKQIDELKKELKK